MVIPVIQESEIIQDLQRNKNRFFEGYYAFYSSWYGGIVKDPHWMLLPIDDHMVHRGDGVFEGMKAVNRSIYLFNEHINRLFRSAEKIGLQTNYNFDSIKEIVVQTAQAADKDNVMIRLFLSRGPGNFSVNPYDSVGAQFYVVITQLKDPASQQVTLGKSIVPIKTPFFAQIKSCNYLANVLMKKEALDRGFDYVVGIDAQGNITESATENVMIVDNKGVIVHPPLDKILSGTTMIRACELARGQGWVTESREISVNELLIAREVMMVGTTINVLPVIQFEGRQIGDAKTGPVAAKLIELLLQDVKSGARGVSF